MISAIAGGFTPANGVIPIIIIITIIITIIIITRGRDGEGVPAKRGTNLLLKNSTTKIT